MKRLITVLVLCFSFLACRYAIDITKADLPDKDSGEDVVEVAEVVEVVEVVEVIEVVEFIEVVDVDSEGDVPDEALDAHEEAVDAEEEIIPAYVSGGAMHTCVVLNTGAVKCWGDNGDGQIGDNSTIDRFFPVDVYGLSSGISSVFAGGFHTCALTRGGEARCWGDNYYGQLGIGSAGSDSVIPVNVSSLASDISDMCTSLFHSCVLLVDGTIKCWGYNGDGQLGDGTQDSSYLPITVSTLMESALDITCGTFHTCAVMRSGGVKCWGRGRDGQLGNGSEEGSILPVDVMDLPENMVSLDAGSRHNCALSGTGRVMCWGVNDYGQLGDGTVGGQSAVPVEVSGLTSGATMVSCGAGHGCALLDTGRAVCWGKNSSGQLGDGTMDDRLLPVEVDLLEDVIQISNGFNHTCAIETGPVLKCWGANSVGQLGDGTTDERPSPVNVVFP